MLSCSLCNNHGKQRLWPPAGLPAVSDRSGSPNGRPKQQCSKTLSWERTDDVMRQVCAKGMQEGKAGSIHSDLDLQSGLSLSSGKGQLGSAGEIFLVIFQVVHFRFLNRSGVFCWSKLICPCSPKGHLKSVSVGPDHESEMPTVISGSCFWKPKRESLAREELPFDLKHKNSSKSSLSPDQQGSLSFGLWLS